MGVQSTWNRRSAPIYFNVYWTDDDDVEPTLEDEVFVGEPADVETEIRRGYFTDQTRDEIQDHYKNQYMLPYGLNFLTIKLNFGFL